MTRSTAFLLPMRAYDIATNRPWLLTEPAYRDLLEIAARLRSDEDLAATIRAERASRPAAIALQSGKPLDGAKLTTVRNSVALIPVTGPIFRYADMFTEMSGATALATITADFGAALRDPSVTAILFWMDSPGGEATGIADAAEQIYQARNQKPIETYAETACSAAYWLASATSCITAEANAWLGSVGTVMAIPDPTKRSARDIEIVSSQSPNKRPDVSTEGGRGKYQRIADQMTETFVNAVARNRGMTPEAVVQDFDQGGVLVGAYAVAAKMADAVGTFEQTLTRLQSLSSKENRFISRLNSSIRSTP